MSGQRPQSGRKGRFSLGLPLAVLLVVLVLVVMQMQPGGLAGVLAGLMPQTGTDKMTSNEDTQQTATADKPTPALTGQTSQVAQSSQTSEPTPEPTAAPQEAWLAAVGDIILHQSVIDGGLVSSGQEQTYDYRPAFQYVKPILTAADLSLANYEGTLAGPPYSGYPFFCAPDEIADALYDSGIRVAWTANNHTLDKGLAGVVRTATVFRERGFHVIGTRPDETVRSDAVVAVNGIKIGLLAYSFETIGTETRRALNGIPMPAEAEPLIDSFNPNRDRVFEADLAEMLDRADQLRQEGAELICLSLHWGHEYQTKSSSFQRKMAQRLADAGIELIIGHHPHVLQEISVLNGKDGKPTLVFYSIGNFLHNMEYNTHNTAGYAQDAVIATVRLVRRQGVAVVAEAGYIPTYVSRVAKGKGWQHLIVPVLPAIGAPQAYQSNPDELEASLTRTRSVLLESVGTDDLPIREQSGESMNGH